MTITDTWIAIDEKRVAGSLQEACEKLGGAGDEVVVDFSSVQRIDPSGLRAIEALAGVAAGKDIKVVLRGVNVDIYRVLKLARLTSRFTFAT
jgi:anti-anti-sigma regulatory factor